jgi:hypothetical protein
MERTVKKILSRWLKRQGWKVKVSWRKSHGPDIIATKDKKKWIIEAKGKSYKSSVKKVYFITVLGEILRRMNDPDAEYFIAFPDFESYREYWKKLPNLAKSKAGLSVIFVDELGEVEVLTKLV